MAETTPHPRRSDHDRDEENHRFEFPRGIMADRKQQKRCQSDAQQRKQHCARQSAQNVVLAPDRFGSVKPTAEDRGATVCPLLISPRA
jgi:hypothetical protein